MRVLDVVITAEHASIESEIMSVILSYAQPIEVAVVVDSQKYPYLVGFRAKLSYDRLRMLVVGWPCKSRNPGKNAQERMECRSFGLGTHLQSSFKRMG